MIKIYVTLVSILLLLCAAVLTTTVIADEASFLNGTITDVEGTPVQGALLYVYNSPDVRRTADFMTSLTSRDGEFSIMLPAGKYWLVARVKKGEEYGPLMPGDKHSGDPAEIELIAGGKENMDFIVADLRDAIKMKGESMDRPYKITGRIIDKNGEPLIKSYAIANRSSEMGRIPDFVSAWTDDRGRFTLYIPDGTYFLGGAEEFPPGGTYFMSQEIAVNADKSDMEIVKKETR